MKIVEVTRLAIPEIKVIRFARFRDHRGYFTEHYRESDFNGHEGLDCLRGITFSQMNESFSRPGTIRGMHFQWNPYHGKAGADPDRPDGRPDRGYSEGLADVRQDDRLRHAGTPRR